MHTMLGGLGQGLLMFGRDGLCFDTYFSACLTLLRWPPAGRPIAEVLGIEASARSRFQTAIDLAYSDDCAIRVRRNHGDGDGAAPDRAGG